MDERKIPILGVLAAAIFAIQALNIPIPWGTSGHMVGAAMAAIILGSPFAGVLLITLVLFVQAFLFGDGGVLALGANILSMGVVASFVGYYSFSAIKAIDFTPITKKYSSVAIAAFIGGWLALFTSAIVTTLQLYLAGTFPLVEGLLIMGLYHAVIGIVAEGVITSIAVTAIVTYRSDILAFDDKRSSKEAVSA